MITNRISKSLVVLLILAAALVSVSFAIRPANVTTTNHVSKKEAGFSNVVSNTYLPLPPGKQTQLYNADRAAKSKRDLYHRDVNWRPAAGMCLCPVCSDSGVDVSISPDFLSKSRPVVSIRNVR